MTVRLHAHCQPKFAVQTCCFLRASMPVALREGLCVRVSGHFNKFPYTTRTHSVRDWSTFSSGGYARTSRGRRRGAQSPVLRFRVAKSAEHALILIQKIPRNWILTSTSGDVRATQKTAQPTYLEQTLFAKSSLAQPCGCDPVCLAAN